MTFGTGAGRAKWCGAAWRGGGVEYKKVTFLSILSLAHVRYISFFPSRTKIFISGNKEEKSGLVSDVQ